MLIAARVNVFALHVSVYILIGHFMRWTGGWVNIMTRIGRFDLSYAASFSAVGLVLALDSYAADVIGSRSAAIRTLWHFWPSDDKTGYYH